MHFLHVSIDHSVCSCYLSPEDTDDELSGRVIAATVVVPLLFLIVIVVLIVLIAVLVVWKRRGGSCK